MGARRIALAATAILATGLALTGCSSTSGSTSANAAGGASATASVGATAGASSTSAPFTSAPSTGASTGSTSTGGSNGGSGGGSGSAKGNECTAASLRAGVLGPSGYASDQQPAVAAVHVVNVSSSSCTLYGYPGVKVADDQGKSSPITAGRATGSPVTSVTLKPGQVANANLEYNDINTQGTASAEHVCGVQSSQAQVILPDTTTVLEVKVTGGGVDGNTLNICGNALTVQPFEGVPGVNA
jgi:hypothetical protein